MRRPQILLFSNWFAPGYRAGGSQLAIINLVRALRDEFDFKVVTRDRDVGADHSFDGSRTACWTSLDGIEVRYLRPAELNFLSVQKIIRSTPHDLLHLNSVVSLPFTAFPLLAKKLAGLSKAQVLISPHGEMSKAALAKKGVRKAFYLRSVKAMGLFEKATWHATSGDEERDIARVWGPLARIRLAPLLPPVISNSNSPSRTPKSLGEIRAVYLARIDRMKNLELAIELIASTANATLDIYGPVGQQDYWAECQRKIAASPRPTAFRHCGSIPPDNVASTLSKYDLLVQPSQSENFGYAILEALAAGCPVLISDRTPWRGLEEKGVGFDISLDRPKEFLTALERIRALDEAAHRDWRNRSRTFAAEFIANSTAKSLNSELYRAALGSG